LRPIFSIPIHSLDKSKLETLTRFEGIATRQSSSSRSGVNKGLLLETLTRFEGIATRRSEYDANHVPKTRFLLETLTRFEGIATCIPQKPSICQPKKKPVRNIDPI